MLEDRGSLSCRPLMLFLRSWTSHGQVVKTAARSPSFASSRPGRPDKEPHTFFRPSVSRQCQLEVLIQYCFWKLYDGQRDSIKLRIYKSLSCFPTVEITQPGHSHRLAAKHRNTAHDRHSTHVRGAWVPKDPMLQQSVESLCILFGKVGVCKASAEARNKKYKRGKTGKNGEIMFRAFRFLQESNPSASCVGCCRLSLPVWEDDPLVYHPISTDQTPEHGKDTMSFPTHAQLWSAVAMASCFCHL